MTTGNPHRDRQIQGVDASLGVPLSVDNTRLNFAARWAAD
jgi:hypothetical protein